eukprot:5644715-Pleurochrysis_carterae.AAC.4
MASPARPQFTGGPMADFASQGGCNASAANGSSSSSTAAAAANATAGDGPQKRRRCWRNALATACPCLVEIHQAHGSC